MKKNNSPVIFMHDKRLIEKTQKTIRTDYMYLILLIIIGFEQMFFGANLWILLLWTLGGILCVYCIRARLQHLIGLLEFFQDDYIKNHPELPKDSSMLER